MLGWLDDAVLLLVLALAFPLAILVVRTPIALAVRLLVALGRRLVLTVAVSASLERRGS